VRDALLLRADQRLRRRADQLLAWCPATIWLLICGNQDGIRTSSW
jgi:hypothetical protein